MDPQWVEWGAGVGLRGEESMPDTGSWPAEEQECSPASERMQSVEHFSYKLDPLRFQLLS